MSCKSRMEKKERNAGIYFEVVVNILHVLG